jgi:hypothetical protein
MASCVCQQAVTSVPIGPRRWTERRASIGLTNKARCAFLNNEVERTSRADPLIKVVIWSISDQITTLISPNCRSLRAGQPLEKGELSRSLLWRTHEPAGDGHQRHERLGHKAITGVLRLVDRRNEDPAFGGAAGME